MRDNRIDPLKVLNKVKQVLFIPGWDMLTIRQVADYYEVDFRTIQKIYQRHKNDLDTFGVKSYNSKTILSEIEKADCYILQTQGGLNIEGYNGACITIPNCGTTCFSTKAVLRIGLFLRDNEVAKEVRTQFINMIENPPSEQQEAVFGDEVELLLAIAHASISGDETILNEKIREYARFAQKQLLILREENKKLITENEKLKSSN